MLIDRQRAHSPSVDESMHPPVADAGNRKWHKRIFALASVSGVLTLVFVSGAAVMFFQMPASDALAKAFVGCRAWFERSDFAAPKPENEVPPTNLAVDRPLRTSDGYTLCTFARVNSDNTAAYLFDMQLKVQHRWEVPFSKIWPNPRHVPEFVKDSYVCFFACHLYPNGDLLAVLHGVQNTVVGYGLVKLDKDSNILWSYAAGTHHTVDVSNDGTIYAVQQELVNSMPDGLGFVPTPCMVDSVVALTPDGKVKGKPISIIEAFRDSPYAELLQSLKQNQQADDKSASLMLKQSDGTPFTDALHTNTIEVLTPQVAKKHPEWKAGQLLITLRNLDAIAVLDPESRTIVWAAEGPWRRLHDAQFLDDGNLLLFDNNGLTKCSRVMEYDPRTQAIPWSYDGENWHGFYSRERGMSQRLPNGNTLAVNSVGGEILEVTPQKEVVWSFAPNCYIPYARRLTSDQVPFLPKSTKPRP